MHVGRENPLHLSDKCTLSSAEVAQQESGPNHLFTLTLNRFNNALLITSRSSQASVFNKRICEDRPRAKTRRQMPSLTQTQG